MIGSIDRGVSTEVRAAIGAVVVEFQGLEHHIAWLAWTLLPVPQRIGQIVTAELSFARQCDLVCALFLELHGDTPMLERLRQLVGAASILEQERNNVVHSEWAFGVRMKTTAKRRGIKFQDELHTDDGKLVELARRCNENAAAFMEFSHELSRSGLDGSSMMATYLPLLRGTTRSASRLG